MAITGFTGNSQLDDSTQAEIVSGQVVTTAYPNPIADAFCAALGGHDEISGSNIKSYTRLGSLSAAGLTQGTDASPTALSDSQRSITVSEHGVGVAYGDQLLVTTSTPQGKARVQALMRKAYADRVDSQILALNTSFTDTVGVSAGAMTEDRFLQAIHELEENDVVGPYFSILNTTPIDSLRVAIAGASGNTGAIFRREGILSRVGPQMENSYVFTLYECDVFLSRNCPLNTSSVDRVGCMLPMNPLYYPVRRLIGRFQDEAGAPYTATSSWAGQLWDGRYTEERDESGRLTEMWLTGLWATGLVALDYGVGMVSIA